MNYLLESQISAYLNQEKPIEQLIGFFESDGHKCLRWIEIQKDGKDFILALHDVFDDSNEGLESIYDYSYVESDDLYGKGVLKSADLTLTLKEAEKLFKTSNDRYMPSNYLDSVLAGLRNSE